MGNLFIIWHHSSLLMWRFSWSALELKKQIMVSKFGLIVITVSLYKVLSGKLTVKQQLLQSFCALLQFMSILFA